MTSIAKVLSFPDLRLLRLNGRSRICCSVAAELRK
jgi:hypothetical protein